MYRNILVAIDNSSMAHSIFVHALSSAKENQANLLLLHVLSSDEEYSPLLIPSFSDELDWTGDSEMGLMRWQEQWKIYESECLERLQTLATEAREAGIAVEFQQVAGGPGRTIVHVAKTWEADLIVMGSRGHSGLSELMLGSVSNYVLHHAPCSVLTVKI